MRLYQRVNGKLSPDDVEDIVRRTVASARLEGMVIPPDEIEMLRRFAADEISGDDYMAWALGCAGVGI